MNTGDYCTVGRELYSNWKAWDEYSKRGQNVRAARPRAQAWQRWMQHKDKCKQCGGHNAQD